MILFYLHSVKLLVGRHLHLVLIECDMVNNIYCLFIWLRIIPRRVAQFSPVYIYGVVRCVSFPWAVCMSIRRPEERLVDGRRGKVYVALDDLVVICFGDNGSVNLGCSMHGYREGDR